MFNHAVAKGAIFLLLGCVALRIGQPVMSQMAGLAKRMPFTAAGLVVGGLSLIGIPGTVGFVSDGGCRERLVVARGTDCDQFAARRRLRVALDRGLLLPRVVAENE
jgi:NADH:ubiquinone oxidoreductase subunit 5 (subunit L)/multisubunit Na+/H+ antiporter MnhA subunit